jgi:predicted phosphodiesterase
MKILIIADEESRALWDYYTPDKLEGVDLIISCGDLKAEYLEFLVTMCRARLLYVPGNHDSRYVEHSPEGCENIDGKVFTFGGIRFFGLGGSMKYGIEPYMYTEKEMRRKIWHSKVSLINNAGFDVLVTHSPARGYGDMDDLPHKGFECFNELMERCRPKYMLHGHVHATYGSRFKRVLNHPSGTRIINGYERYILELDENNKADLTKREIISRLIGAFL